MTIATGQPMLASDINDLTFFPKGTILTFSTAAWNTTSAEFKNIWKICDGTNGTPNLVNKFLRGGLNSGATGDGKKTLSANELPAHKHSITDKAHTHNILAITEVATSWANRDTKVWHRPESNVFSTAGYVSSSNTGITETNNNTGGGNAFDVIPAFYTVIYIIKVA
jgi:microcystin-dependent protein